MDIQVPASTLLEVYKNKLQMANEENALLHAEVIELTNKLNAKKAVSHKAESTKNEKDKA